MKPRRILIYCPMPESGFAEHSHYQASALVRAGVDALVLTSPGFLPNHRDKPYRVLPWLLPPFLTFRQRWMKALWFAFVTVANELLFAFRVLFWGHRHVLIAGTSDTLALIWVWPHVLLRAFGVRYAANIHDPQRKRPPGRLLHGWQVRSSFFPIEFALVHEDFDSYQPDIPDSVPTLPVPYGCMGAEVMPSDGTELRHMLLDGHPERRIFLAFGYIADRKNLEVSIRALAGVPEAVLIIAGRVASTRDRPAAYYHALARELNCTDRVRIDDGFIPDPLIPGYFGAADYVLLTYRSEFVSQSGVLLLASQARKPVLASSGPGPLTRTVARFDLGPVIAPDDIDALRGAMRTLIDRGYSASGWDGFCAHMSWDRNVATLLQGFAGPEEAAGRTSAH